MGEKMSQLEKYDCLLPVVEKVKSSVGEIRPYIIAIDGRCGSGKTAIAEILSQQLNCSVVHMDDFYLPLSQREQGWEYKYGANMDFYRLRNEILIPLMNNGENIPYRAYSCRDGEYIAKGCISTNPVIILEGSYLFHPHINVPFNQCVYVTCSEECQREQLMKREGENYKAFRERWIPLEKAYFKEMNDEMNYIFDTTDWW